MWNYNPILNSFIIHAFLKLYIMKVNHVKLTPSFSILTPSVHSETNDSSMREPCDQWAIIDLNKWSGIEHMVQVFITAGQAGGPLISLHYWRLRRGRAGGDLLQYVMCSRRQVPSKSVQPCSHQAIAEAKATSLYNGLKYFLFEVYTKQLAMAHLHGTKQVCYPLWCDIKSQLEGKTVSW